LFDGQKFKRVVEALGIHQQVVEPLLLEREVWEATHTEEYLASLQKPEVLAAILELPLPPEELLASMRLQYCGTIQAAWLAMERGWAIHVGGGFHHASANRGHGFCVYNDLSATVWSLLEGWRGKQARRILIVDLDAHQGDGYEQDLQQEVEAGEVYVLDAYNPGIFPGRRDLKQWIGSMIPYLPGDRGEGFLRTLRWELPLVIEQFRPDMVLYNSGTDSMEGDPLGGLQQSPEAIVERDRFVFEECKKWGVPICMTLSGGYQPRSAEVIATSIRGLLGCVCKEGF
jgi:histone deacetylase 11